MKTNHTPGPWHVAHSPHYGTPFVTSSTGKLSLTGNVGPVDVQTAEANARLIAAAPELLAECRYALAALQGSANPTAAIAGLTRAIAKVTN